MKIKRKAIITISIVVIAIAIGVTYLIIDKMMDDGFTQSLDEFKEKLENNQSECYYEDYVKLEKKLEFKTTTNIRNESVDEIDYYIRWENKTDTPIEFNWEFYCEKELREKYITVANPMNKQFDEPMILEPKMGLQYSYAPAIHTPSDRYKSDDTGILKPIDQ